MLKKKLAKDVWEKLSDEMKPLYKEKDGEYVLDTEGDDDVGELRRALDRVKQDNKDLKAANKEALDKLEETTGIDAKKRGDIELLEKSWKDKFDKREKELLDKLTGKDKFIETTLVDSVANTLASKISTAPAVILPHIKARLKADLEGDVPTTKVLDAKGNVSALTIEDLQKELVDNKDFSSIIVASKASGSGATKPTQQGQDGAPLGADGKPKAFRDMTVAERVAAIDAKKQTTE